jgi:PAS domain S-box-containing protein
MLSHRNSLYETNPTTGKYYLYWLSKFFISTVVFTGTLVLAGWQFNSELLRRPIPHLVAMNPLTAFCFVTTGISFLLVSSAKKSKKLTYAGYALAWLVMLLSVLKLSEMLFASAWQIDHFLYYNKIKAEASKGLISNMAVNTALGFIFSDMAILFLNKNVKKRWPASDIFALLVFVFGFFSLLGYLYKAPEFYSLLKELPMAVHTAACFILISLAVFFVYPDRGITKEFTGPLVGAFVGRIFIGFVFIIPVVLGAIRIYISQHKIILISPQLGTSLLVLLLIIFFCFLLLYNVILLNRKDLLQKKVEEDLRESREIFQSLVMNIKDYAIFMLDVNGNIVTWNKGAEFIKGYKEEEIIGKHISVFYTNEDLEKKEPERVLNMAREKGRFEEEGLRVRKDGSVFWADVIVTTLYDEKGELNGFAKVTRDITERKRTEDILEGFNEELSRQVKEKTAKIEETTAELRQLSAHLEMAREEEREYIAREIHDELGQMLTGLRMDIVWLRKKTADTDETIMARFERTLELLNDTRQTLRRIYANLHPAMLADLGLTTSLSAQCREFESRSEIRTNFTAEINGLNEMEIASDIAIGLYRAFQESLTNVAKHSEATEVNASLKKEGNQLVMHIADNGRGFKPEEIVSKKTLGLISIRERALMLNGECKIESAPGAGTHILLRIPLKLK